MRGSAIIRSSWAQGCCWHWRFGAGGGAGELECLGAQGAEAPLSAAEDLQCAAKTPLIEVRPQTVAEVQLGKRAFPQQKIAEAPFASGANQQVDLAGRMRAMIHFEQQAMEVRGGQIRVERGAPRRLHDAVLGRVVDRNAQEHSRARRARSLALLDGPKQVRPKPI